MSNSSFSQKVYDAVQKIPRGKVATYSQIAELCGSPGAARAVGNILHKNPSPELIPCYRVVNARGQLSGAFAFGGILAQREKLREEGVEIPFFQVDLYKYQWEPKMEE